MTACQIKTPRREQGRFGHFVSSEEACEPHSFLRNPENFFWNRDTRPPRSSSCWAPPIQAGCDLESKSMRNLSPALPQVERVWYSVPSVIPAVIVCYAQCLVAFIAIPSARRRLSSRWL